MKLRCRMCRQESEDLGPLKPICKNCGNDRYWDAGDDLLPLTRGEKIKYSAAIGVGLLAWIAAVVAFARGCA